MFDARLIQVRSDQARQVVSGGNGPVGLINRDLANRVYLGPDEGFSAAGQAVAVVDPLAALPLDGLQDVWALTQSGTAVINAVGGGLGFQPSPADVAQQEILLGLPAQIAASIATGDPGGAPGGVPLLSAKNVLAQSSTAIPGGTTADLPSAATWFTASQIGYEIYLALSCPVTVTAIPVNVILFWSDSVSGQVTGVESYWVYAGTTASPHTIFGRGRTKGDQLRIALATFVVSQTVTAQYTIMQTSRVFARDFWQSFQPAGGLAFNDGLTTSDIVTPNSGYIANFSANIAHNTAVITHMSLYTGAAAIWAHTGSGTTDLSVLIQDTATLNNGLASIFIWRGNSDSSGNLAAQSIPLPRAQCSLVIENNNAANTENIQVNVMALEYETA